MQFCDKLFGGNRGINTFRNSCKMYTSAADDSSGKVPLSHKFFDDLPEKNKEMPHYNPRDGLLKCRCGTGLIGKAEGNNSDLPFRYLHDDFLKMNAEDARWVADEYLQQLDMVLSDHKTQPFAPLAPMTTFLDVLRYATIAKTSREVQGKCLKLMKNCSLLPSNLRTLHGQTSLNMPTLLQKTCVATSNSAPLLLLPCPTLASERPVERRL